MCFENLDTKASSARWGVFCAEHRGQNASEAIMPTLPKSDRICENAQPQRSVSAAGRRANPSRIFDCRPRDSSAAVCNRSWWKFNSWGSLGAGEEHSQICNLGRLLSTWSKYANKSHLKCFQLSGMTTPGGAVHTKH